MTDSTKSKLNQTKTTLLEAAKTVLVSDGYAGLSTRAVAAVAGTQMSQIRYHFGSKEGLILALFEYMNDQLIERQTDLHRDPALPISTKWDIACDYLDQDITSGYVRVLQELIAVGWSNSTVAAAISASLLLWLDLHMVIAREAELKFGSLGPFDAEDLPALATAAFIGVEVLTLLGQDRPALPLRRALRRLGDVIRHFEGQQLVGDS